MCFDTTQAPDLGQPLPDQGEELAALTVARLYVKHAIDAGVPPHITRRAGELVNRLYDAAITYHNP